MEEKRKKMLRKLKNGYEAACNAYKDELLRMWELDEYYGNWNSDQPGTIYHYGDTHNLSMEEIMYIVDNDVKEDTVLEWEDYGLTCYEFNWRCPSLDAWCRGCPRESKETIEKFRSLKEELKQKAAEVYDAVSNFEKNPVLSKRIVDCDLSVRTINICKSNDIEFVSDLVKMSRTDWLKQRNAGRRSLTEITDFLEDNGLSWRNDY